MAHRSGIVPPYVDIVFPVLWRYGEVLNVDGIEDAREMSEERQALIYYEGPNPYHIFFEPEDFWHRMPNEPIHAVLRHRSRQHVFGGSPHPRLWFVAGVYVDHRNRPYEIYWVCDLVGTYVRYTGP